MNRKPNIIIINPDEMRWDTMGHMGNPAAVTPTLDNFAFKDAVSFSNAYCQNPVCVPSRCSFSPASIRIRRDTAPWATFCAIRRLLF